MADPKGLLVVPIGFRSDGSLHALELDNSDRLKVLIDPITGSVTVTQTTPANLTVGHHAWINAAWQKQPIINGFSGVVNEEIILLGAAAGVNTLVSVAVPAGEIWTINAASFVNNVSATGANYLQVVSGGVVTTINVVNTLAINLHAAWAGNIVLGVGDKIQIVFQACVAGDTLRFRYHGYRTDIDQ